MQKIEWNDNLEIGSKLIDDQHRMLVQKLNDMSNAVEMNRGTKEISKTLDFLIQYTDFHFTTEEKHMEATNFPGLDTQKKEHEKFKGTLADLEEDFTDEGATKRLADSIDTFLVNWLINHIKGKDLAFGAFLQEQGIEIKPLKI